MVSAALISTRTQSLAVLACFCLILYVALFLHISQTSILPPAPSWHYMHLCVLRMLRSQAAGICLWLSTPFNMDQTLRCRSDLCHPALMPAQHADIYESQIGGCCNVLK
jgi:hypothetical protein